MDPKLNRSFPAVIPALDPDRRLCVLADQLHQRGIAAIVIVNDGSRAACDALFRELQDKPFCTVLHHAVNRGKGAALRTAFRHCLAHYPDAIGCITADADGQHCVKDVLRVAGTFRQNPHALILGKRDLTASGVPWKSRLGNALIRRLFRLAAGLRLGDTQTGLRAIPAAVMAAALDLPGNRFEFETEMLLLARDAAVPLLEIPIRTLYRDRNAATHFRPVRDALKIGQALLCRRFRHAPERAQKIRRSNAAE